MWLVIVVFYLTVVWFFVLFGVVVFAAVGFSW